MHLTHRPMTPKMFYEHVSLTEFELLGPDGNPPGGVAAMGRAEDRSKVWVAFSALDCFSICHAFLGIDRTKCQDLAERGPKAHNSYIAALSSDMEIPTPPLMHMLMTKLKRSQS